MDKIIELRDVTAYRGQTRALDGLSLEIGRGVNTVILGPNGAGKTTLLQLFTRELYPVQQEDSWVRLFGKERWNVRELRGRLGIVSNDLHTRYLGKTRGIRVILSGLHASMDVYRHQTVEPADRKKAEELMHHLGISELRDRIFGEMSTGQQRRFLLGRALINDPETLVLDEPTSGLDLEATFKYLQIIRQIMEAGRTIILATHHIHEIPPEVGRVILLRDGRVIDQGAKAEMLTDRMLSELFSTPVQVVQVNGYFQAVPGTERP